MSAADIRQPSGRHLLGGQAEQEKILRADRFADLDVCAVQRADGQCPVNENFMLPVPEASLPAVDICSDRSAAG